MNVVGDVLSAAAPTSGYTSLVSQGATKTDTPLLETPQTVDVITRQQMNDQGSRTVNEALRYTPGVFTGLAGASARQDVAALRGFHAGDVNNTFLDGLRLMSDAGTYTNFQIDPFFLERIDVVKGPSSVLYGRAMPGGLVSYTTKRPQKQAARHIQFYGGNFDTYGGGVDITGALPNVDWGAYRVIGHAETTDTQYDVVKRENYALMPEVSLDLAPDTTLLLQAYLSHNPAGGFHGAVPYDLSVSGRRFGRKVDPSWVDVDKNNARFQRDQRLVSYQLDHRVDDHVSLHSKARYSDVETELAQVYQIGFSATPPILNRYYSGADEHLKALSFDNYADITFATGAIEHDLLLGLGYQQRTVRARNYGAAATPLDPFHPDYDQDALVGAPALTTNTNRKLKQYGVYLQDQMQWRRWHLLLSGREDHLRREYLDYNSANSARDGRSDSAFSGRAALLYRSRFGIAPYVSYSEAFNPSTDTSVDGVVPEPEDSSQYEIGIKYQPNGLNALFTLALYDLTQRNVQQRDAVTPISYQSVGDIQSRGVEFTAKADLAERLHVTAGYSYNDIAYQDDFTDASGNAVRAGNTPVLSPEQLASLWLEYDLPHGVSAGLGGRYVGESYANSRNDRKVDDYAVADAFIGFDLGQVATEFAGASLRVNANNLFDDEHVTGCFNDTYCYYGRARTVTATLDYRF